MSEVKAHRQGLRLRWRSWPLSCSYELASDGHGRFCVDPIHELREELCSHMPVQEKANKKVEKPMAQSMEDIGEEED